jgi:hypothetical protein
MNEKGRTPFPWHVDINIDHCPGFLGSDILWEALLLFEINMAEDNMSFVIWGHLYGASIYETTSRPRSLQTTSYPQPYWHISMILRRRSPTNTGKVWCHSLATIAHRWIKICSSVSAKDWGRETFLMSILDQTNRLILHQYKTPVT